MKSLAHFMPDRRLFDDSAQLSYYFLISLFPFLLLLVTLCSYLPVPSENILSVLRDYAPEATYEYLLDNLNIIMSERRGDLLSISIIITVYVASLGFQSLVRILDQIYGVTENRPLWKEAILGLFLMLGLVITFLLSVILPIIIGPLTKYINFIANRGSVFLAFITLIRWLFSSLGLFLIFIILYMVAPNLKIKMRHALPGAIISTLGWQISSLLFSWYVLFWGQHSLIYGQLSTVIILLGWIYWSSLVLIVGGYINAYIYMKHKPFIQKDN